MKNSKIQHKIEIGDFATVLNREYSWRFSEAKLLAPEMYIEAEILTTTIEHPALPIEAVANIDNDYFALVKENDTTFKKVLVKVGASNNAFIQILNYTDFKPDTEFLTKEAFNLITE